MHHLIVHTNSQNIFCISCWRKRKVEVKEEADLAQSTIKQGKLRIRNNAGNADAGLEPTTFGVQVRHPYLPLTGNYNFSWGDFSTNIQHSSYVQ